GAIGYCDHTDGELAVLAAVARGAKIIEKHVTILRDVPNAQDWKVSAGPENFAELVARIRTTEALIGHGRKQPAASEEAGMAWAKKSLVAACDLAAGTVLREEDLIAKRPGDGVIANRIGDLTGRTLKVAIEADDPVLMEHVA
ncbi:unnamed protein product, partial [Laminaria digitata]